MKESVLREKSKEFGKEIILLCRRMGKVGVERSLVDQLLRSGTSIGANIHEAQYAQGKKDFISKLEISLKECNETDYWLELFSETETISREDYQRLKSRVVELRRMLVASVTTLKKE